MKYPYFSIIVPCYNVEKYVAEAINSILEQSFEDWEAIVVNDGSTHNTPQITEQLAAKDSRIKYFSKPNEGVAPTRNYAITKATAKYCALLDSDDCWLPDYLSSQKQFIDNLGTDKFLIYTNTYLIIDNIKTRRKHYPDIVNFKVSSDRILTLKEMIAFNKIFVMVVFEKRMFEEIGGFDSNLRAGEDYDLWLRAIYKGYKPIFNPIIKAYYRIGFDSLTGNRSRMLDSHLMIYNKIIESFELSAAEKRAAFKALCKTQRERLIDLIKTKIRLNSSIKSELAELCKLNCDKKIIPLRLIMKMSPSLAEKAVRQYFLSKH